MTKHIHQFLRIPAKKTHTWTCTRCSWFVHDGLSHILLTKDSICWGCSDIFHLSEAAIAEDKPRCDACRGIDDDVVTRMLREKGLLEDKDE